MSRLVRYLKDTRAELRHVSWPSQRQATVYTLLVIVISGLTAAFVSVFDRVFTAALDLLIHLF